jgi:hypothetical protein
VTSTSIGTGFALMVGDVPVEAAGAGFGVGVRRSVSLVQAAVPPSRTRHTRTATMLPTERENGVVTCALLLLVVGSG